MPPCSFLALICTYCPKSFGRFSALSPGPVSVTETRMTPSPPTQELVLLAVNSGCSDSCTVICPCSGVNLSALVRKLRTTCSCAVLSRE